MVLVLHIFGVITWLGSLLLITSLMTLVPDEVGAARERMIFAARRLFLLSANVGAAVAIIFGLFELIARPGLLQAGWMHVKILLVLVLLAIHVRLFMRINAAENDPGAATRREFSILHGIVSLILLAILYLVIARPF
ncbi:MAG TPA: CopD family protein [Candidatus Binataceae bacterium]|nr:CopD family protein [Candidatus Binataceae bacterium]